MAPIDQSLTINDDPTVVTEHFARWHNALLENATRRPTLWSQPTEGFVFRNEDDPGSAILGARTALGEDFEGKNWAVQINMATIPGDPNVMAAVALDSSNRPFLIRQGRLNSNNQNKSHIRSEEFAIASGLTQATVVNGDTRIRRDWYVVTPLHVSNEDIVAILLGSLTLAL